MEAKERLEQMSDAKRRMKRLVSHSIGILIFYSAYF